MKAISDCFECVGGSCDQKIKGNWTTRRQTNSRSVKSPTG